MNKDKRLASFLTTLLGVCVVTEATLGTYVGLKMFMAKQEQEFQAARYEAYLEEQEQRRENPPKIQYAGPTMRVVDGVLMDWDDNIIPDPVPVEAGRTAPDVSMSKPNLEENTTEPEAAPPVQQTSKPVDSAGSNSSNSKADSSGSADSGNQSSETSAATSSKNENGTYDRSDWPTGKLLASNNSSSKKYHNKNCKRGAAGAAYILPENEIWFDSEQDAINAGYSQCGICY